jgi:hypothetical protein
VKSKIEKYEEELSMVEEELEEAITENEKLDLAKSVFLIVRDEIISEYSQFVNEILKLQLNQICQFSIK